MSPVNTVVTKIRRLLGAREDELTAQAKEMILSLDDPEVDAWVLSDINVGRIQLPEVWELPSEPLQLGHPGVPREALLGVLGRLPSDGPAAVALRKQLPRLYLDGTSRTGCDVSWVGGLPWLSELIVSGVRPGGWYRKTDIVERGRLTGLDGLAGLPALDRLVVIGVADLDLAALVALPGVRRLSVYGCTLAAGSYHLTGGTIARLDLDSVPGLTRITPPPGLRELHLTALPNLTGVGDLTAATALTDLSIVDCPRITALPPLPPPATPGTGGAPGTGLRRVRLGCPALTSIAPLAGRPLDHLDLSGCAALTSLDGFPGTLGATRLSLNGCAALGDVSAVAGAGRTLRCIDLRGATGVSDIAALDRLPDLGTVALAGTATGPEAVPATLLRSCTWAHTPALDLLGDRPRQYT